MADSIKHLMFSFGELFSHFVNDDYIKQIMYI